MAALKVKTRTIYYDINGNVVSTHDEFEEQDIVRKFFAWLSPPKTPPVPANMRQVISTDPKGFQIIRYYPSNPKTNANTIAKQNVNAKYGFKK